MYEKLAAIVRIPQSTQHLQRWLYCREHLKYVWNVYCVVTNAITCEIFTPQKPQATNSFLVVTEQIIFVVY